MKRKETITKTTKTQVKVEVGSGTSSKGNGICGEQCVKRIVCRLVYME